MRILLTIITMLVSLMANASSSPALFNTDSYNKLVAEKTRPFVMVLWSLDCPPCMHELNMLGQLFKNNSDLNLVLISTDSNSQKQEINNLIEEYGLSDVDSWVFSKDPQQSLRYSIDPAWYGELPRSYFHNKDKRSAVSGLLSEAKLLSWLKDNAIKTND